LLSAAIIDDRRHARFLRGLREIYGRMDQACLTGPTKVSSIDTFHCCADCIDVEEVANTTSAPSLSNADERFPLTEEEFEKVRQLIWKVTISELNIRWREDLQKG
jgi:hypothetical protein